MTSSNAPWAELINTQFHMYAINTQFHTFNVHVLVQVLYMYQYMSKQPIASFVAVDELSRILLYTRNIMLNFNTYT